MIFCMKNIFYIHGFNSWSTSSTVGHLKEFLPNDNIVGLHYHSGNIFNVNFQDLISQVENYNFEHFILIGTSLGGYYAKQLCQYFKVPCILINPVSRPLVQLRQFLGNHTNFYTNEQYVFDQYVLNSFKHGYTAFTDIPTLVYSSSADETLIDGFKRVKLAFSNSHIIQTKTSHQIKDFNELPEFKQNLDTIYDLVVCQLNI